MNYHVKCVDGIHCIFCNGFLTNQFIVRNEESNYFEIYKRSYHEDYQDSLNNAILIYTVPLSYDVDVLLLVYAAYCAGYAKASQDCY